MNKTEIAETMFGRLTDKDKRLLSEHTEDNLIRLHHDLGRYIRNEFGLWEAGNKLTRDWFKACAFNDKTYIHDGIDRHPCHPDAVSMDIIKLVWQKAKGISDD